MSVGAFLSPFVLDSCLLPKCGKFKAAIIGYILEGTALVLFGLVQKFPNDTIFAALSILLRFFDGLGLILTSGTLSIIISTKCQNYETLLTAQMAGLCISEILGSICGGLLFHSLGYLGVMILQSALLFVSCPLLVYFFCLRDRPIVKNKNEDIAEGREVSFSTLIKNPAVVFGIFNQAIPEQFHESLDPLLPFKLSRVFGFDHAEVGSFILQYVTVIAIGMTAMLFVSERINKVPIMVIGNIIFAVGAFLTGPSHIYGLPNSLNIMKVGVIMGAVGRVLTSGPSESYIMKQVEEQYPEQFERASEKVTTLALQIQGIMLIVMPPLSLVLFKLINFEFTMDVWGHICMLYTIAFSVYAVKKRCGVSIKNEEEEEDEEEEERHLLSISEVPNGEDKI